MKKYIFLCFLMLSSNHLFAGSWADGIAGAAEAGQGILRRQAEMDRDEAMMLRHHDLEMQRITREYELMEQQQERIRQREAQQYAAEQQARMQQEALRAKDDERNREAKMRQIEDAHPGWVATTRGVSFLTWRDKQPAFIQMMGASEMASDAILMLDLYHLDQKPHKKPGKKPAK